MLVEAHGGSPSSEEPWEPEAGREQEARSGKEASSEVPTLDGECIYPDCMKTGKDGKDRCQFGAEFLDCG